MSPIVEDYMDIIRRTGLADDGHRAHVHEDGAVSVEAADAPVGTLESDPQGDLGCMAHGPDSQEIMTMTLSGGFSIFEELAADHAGRRDDNILRAESGGDSLDGRFPGQLSSRSGSRRLGSRNVLRGREGALADDEGINAPCIYSRESIRDLVGSDVFIVRKHRIRNPETIQKTQSNLPLLGMLRFILHPWLPSPADNQQGRKPIHIPIHKRSKRIDRIPLPGILHIYARRPPRSKIMPGSKADGATLIGSDNIMPAIQTGRQNSAEILEKTIRDTDKKVDAIAPQRIYEKFRTNHITKIRLLRRNLTLADRNISITVRHDAISRTDDTLAIEIQLLITMRTPAHYTGHGEKRSIYLLRQPQHLIHEARIEVHIGAENLPASLGLIDRLDSQTLQTGHELVLAHLPLLLRQFRRHLLEKYGTRIRKSIDSMTDTIDQARAIVCLLPENLTKIFGDLLLILPVLDVVADMTDHIGDLDIRAAMLRALEGADARSDR